jgi:hypothetical protein
MALFRSINFLSQLAVSDTEGRDITVHFADTHICMMEQGERRPLWVNKEIGEQGTTVLSSLHAIYQMVDIDRLKVDGIPSATAVESPSAGDFAVPEQTMQYDALPHPRCIRLFRINRTILRPIGPKAFDVSLHGTLQAFDLDKAPPYCALSYTWGHPYIDFNSSEPEVLPEISSYITCNGAVLRVTDNLHSALAYLSTTKDFGHLWIDAICINQSDEAEKAAQIAHMDVVYAGATQVLGWLGFPHFCASSIVWATTELVERFSRHEMYLSRRPWPADTLYDPAMDAYFGVDDLAVTLLGAYFFYLACRWFRRAWVLQEVVLAGPRMRLFCGHHELSWAALGDFLRLMHMTGWDDQVASLGRQIASCRDREWMYEVALWQGLREDLARHLCHQPGDGDGDGNGDSNRINSLESLEVFSHEPGTPGRDLSTLHRLLTLTRRLRCSVMQDHVYAAINIAGPEFKSRVQTLTNISYKMQPHDFYLNIATAVASNSRYLDFLIEAGLRDPEPGEGQALPTWVPNYVRAPNFQAFKQHPPTLLDAGCCDQDPPRFSVSGLELRCVAAPFDTIVEVLDHSALPFKADTLAFCAALPATINGRPRFEVLWRTLIFDLSDGKPAPADFAASFLAMIPSRDGPDVSKLRSQGTNMESYFHRIDKHLRELNAAAVVGEGAVTSDDIRAYVDAFTQNALVNPLGRNPLPQKIVEIDRAAFPYIRAMNRSSEKNRLYKTERGRMGVCAGACEVGDDIWTLRNAHVPFVLRPAAMGTSGMEGQGREFRLVGSCFMLDFMQGEMVRDNAKLRSIRII